MDWGGGLRSSLIDQGTQPGHQPRPTRLTALRVAAALGPPAVYLGCQLHGPSPKTVSYSAAAPARPLREDRGGP